MWTTGFEPSAGPSWSRLADVEVEPLAVLEEVGVAVLVAGAPDEDGLLLGHPLGPVLGVGDQVAVLVAYGGALDDVVAGVAAGAEHQGVLSCRRW